MSPEDLQTHIQRLLDDDLSAGEFATLEARLLEDPVALDTYRSWVALHCVLQRHGSLRRAAEISPVVPIDRVLSLQRRRIVRVSLFAAAAAMMLSALVLWLIMSPEPSAAYATLRVVPGSSYTLSHKADTKSPSPQALAPGSMIRLDHGVIEFSLPHEVRAVIEAPATLTLVDERTVDLDHGRAFFEVRSVEGRGFTVVTPQQRIVDLGTAFGVDLPTDSDQVKLHVFEGSVRIDSLENREAGEVITAPRSVAIRSNRVLEELGGPPRFFRRQLPDRVETLFVEDFESGLRARKDYAIQIDPSAIRDHADNRFAGISADEPWRFSTSGELRIRNPGFEAAKVQLGTPVPYWREVTGAQSGFNTYIQEPKPSEGALQLMVGPDLMLAQDLEVPIRAGTTYTLTLDIGNSPPADSRAVVSFFGSDAGHQKLLAGIGVDPPAGGWLRSQILIYTATAEDATGQTLGIALSSVDGRSTFDDLRIFETRAADPAKTPGNPTEDNGPGGQPDTKPPLLSSFDPAPDASHVPLDATPTLVFDEAIRFGTGRIMIRNLMGDSETELIVGSKRTSLHGRVLTFIPPLGLEDGASLNGGLPGWESSGAVSRFNPGGNGHRYRHPDLADDSKARGAIDSMLGPTMASLGTRGQSGTIRRVLGAAEDGRTYTVSVGIGCRSLDTAYTSLFAGYRIRLLCDSVVLNEISGRKPPGPPNSVTPVGFSWDSRYFPGGSVPDAPLVLEISSLHGADDASGYLDLDHVQVTSLAEAGR